MTRIFIDCGYHLGEGMSEFITKLGIDSTWQIYAFEANPACDIDTVSKRHLVPITVYNKAVWIHNEGVLFNQEHNEASNSPKAGSTSELDGWGSCIADLGSTHTFKTQIKIPSLHFSTWLKTLPEDSEIYCKFDIEGAEYEVLRDMLYQGVVSKLKTLWIEWHYVDLKNEDEVSTNLLIKELSQFTEVHSWK